MFRRSAVLLLLLTSPAFGQRGSFWERVADPHRQHVEALVQRAQAELGERPGGGLREGAARAEVSLREALRLDADSFTANVLLGEAEARQGRWAGAASAFARARGLARTPAEESWSALRAAIESSRAGRYADALADYDQHLRLGEAQPAAYANSGEILMALGRLPEAEDRYREAIRLEGQTAAGREHDENLALAYYGLAVALDRDEQPGAAREAAARALELDGKMALIEPGRDDDTGIFFVPAGDVHYYRAVALTVLGRPREAGDAFQRFAAEQPRGRWGARVAAHLAALNPAGDGEGTANRARFRLSAAGTVHADETVPAPLIDATLRARPGLFEPCLGEVPASVGEATRIAIDVDFDVAGTVHRARVVGRQEWGAFATCVEGRLKSGLRVPRFGGTRLATARIELLLALRR
jgi:tetratricopeptide (TPR) repeat protein